MKKFKFQKITMLFLSLLCAISVLIVALRILYFKNKSDKLTNNLEIALENLDIEEKIDKNNESEEENIILSDGAIGMIVIPSIEVKAPIYEGTGLEVLKYAVRTF